MTGIINSSRLDLERSTRERELRQRLDDGSLDEIEIAWSDPFGHAQGKRIPVSI